MDRRRTGENKEGWGEYGGMERMRRNGENNEGWGEG